MLIPRPSIPLIHYRLFPPSEAPREASFTPRDPGAPPNPSHLPSALDAMNPDVYDVDNCAVTEVLRAECRSTPHTIMRLYVAGSAVPQPANPQPGSLLSGPRHGEDPFGFLRMVSFPNAPPLFQLVLLPYNYHHLATIMEDIRTAAKPTPPAPLRQVGALQCSSS